MKENASAKFINNKIKSNNNSENLIKYVNTRSEKFVASCAVSPTLRWTLCVSLPENIYYEPVNRQLKISIILGITFILIGVILMYLLVTITLKPLTHIKNGLENFFLFLNFYLIRYFYIYISNSIPKVPHTLPPLPYPPIPTFWPWRSPVLGHIKFACPMGLSFQ